MVQEPVSTDRREPAGEEPLPEAFWAVARRLREMSQETLAPWEISPSHLRALRRRGAFNFDDAVRGADRMTVAVTLFALLELYKRGEASWTQQENFGEIDVSAAHAGEPRVAEAMAG